MQRPNSTRQVQGRRAGSSEAVSWAGTGAGVELGTMAGAGREEREQEKESGEEWKLEGILERGQSGKERAMVVADVVVVSTVWHLQPNCWERRP